MPESVAAAGGGRIKNPSCGRGPTGIPCLIAFSLPADKIHYAALTPPASRLPPPASRLPPPAKQRSPESPPMLQAFLPPSETAPPSNPPEQDPESLITVGCVVLGGPWVVQMKGNGDEPVLVGPYPTRHAAAAEAERLRQAIAVGTAPDGHPS
jgi:hypothetical protein